MADFRLGRLKFNWRGAWNANTAYEIDDIVKFGGNTYICVVNHTSAVDEAAFYVTDLGAPTSRWNVHVPGYEVTGTWTANVFYKVNDLVTYGNSIYVCTTPHISATIYDPTKFSTYLNGLKFENSWSNSTEYQPGDIVAYGGYTYTAKTINTNVVPSSSSADWGLLVTGLSPVGAWSGATTYKPGDVAQYGGNLYVAIVANTNVKPSSDITKWTFLQTGLRWRGSWSAVSDYTLGEIVFKGASAWINIQEYTIADGGARDPEQAPAYWELFAQGDNTSNVTQQIAAVKAAALTFSLTFGF
jgi:hypothetical protein